ncbi:MAG TPA: translocation/assembly module TamB domain-containing protein, partial [Acidobacteriota bacterium]|nr:translocation/assembly module TamB domain-containing protein [Acidobacteriota bacterium]
AAADLALFASRIRYRRPKMVSVVVDSVYLRFTQTEEESALQGEVTLGPSWVLARVKPQALVPWAHSVERTRPPLPAMLENTRLDVRLRASDSLWIDNNLARIRLSVALAATGSVARPAVAGRVGIQEGYLLYLDRRFTVREGQLLFADPEAINPEIVLRADTRVTTYSGMIATPYLITISVEGTPEELTVNLDSDPPLDKGDILALLTVGATRSQFSGGDANGEGGTRDVLLARSAELAGQRVAGFLTNRVGGALGLEEVSVEGNIFRTSGPDEARLLASRRLSGRLKLTYSTAVGHLNDQALRLNYSLSRRFSLEGQTTQQGRSVLGLQYSVPIK